jgi:23S rRNA (pseudouridine1915-N3)-methyltransferase
MRAVLVNLATAKEDWAEAVFNLYQKKIGHFLQFEIVSLKPKKSAREDSQVKKNEETKMLMDWVGKDDFIILFDERGSSLDSIQYAKKIEAAQGSGKKRLVFVIGGAYGVGDEFRKRSDLQVSLSPMVMNHLVAQAMALEKIYRALTIIKGIPYHNV